MLVNVEDTTSPLVSSVTIVNEEDTPTVYFMRQWELQRKFNEILAEAINSIGYDIVTFMPNTFTNSQLLDRVVFVRSINFSEDFFESFGAVGSNPSAPATLDVQKNGGSVGTISIATNGTVTFSTIGSGDVEFIAGDTISYVNQTPADASLADVSITLKGIRV